MKRAVLLLLALSSMLLMPVAASALQCGSRIVGQGDQAEQVRARCGEPFFVDSYQTISSTGTAVPETNGGAVIYEAWYYNFGPSRLMVRLLFAHGELQDEQTMGYGFSGKPGPCDLESVTGGMSSGELYARCGPPARRRTDYQWNLAHDETWYYPGRDGDRARVVHLRNGHVEDVKVAG